MYSDVRRRTQRRQGDGGVRPGGAGALLDDRSVEAAARDNTYAWIVRTWSRVSR